MVKSKRLQEPELEENFVKKYKVTSQINSSGSFSIKIKRIYSHHDDDAYTMERVNDDCLAEIFMYVPAWERPKIALVCKKWKRVLDDYSWFKVKKLELTYWQYDEYPHFFKKNYPTLDGQFNFLKGLLNKCGHYLRELDLSAYPKSNIVPVINEYCPNLEKLQIRIMYINDAMLDNAFTRLSKLRKLTIIFHHYVKKYIPVTLINSLLNVADTLTELSLSKWFTHRGYKTYFPKETAGVFLQLKALKMIHIADIRLEASLCDYLNSTGIAFSDDQLYRISKITSSFYEDIKKLSIHNIRINDHFLYNIANLMKHLRALDIFSDIITDAGVVALSKMNHLKILKLGRSSDVTDSSIKLLKNLRVLMVPWSKKITNKSVTKVLENSPEMRELVVAHSGVTFEFIEKAKEISKNRKERLILVMPCEDGMSTTKFYEYLTIFWETVNSVPPDVTRSKNNGPGGNHGVPRN